eukprot:38870-Eustigmatos_ZCMA.PRE.1
MHVLVPVIELPLRSKAKGRPIHMCAVGVYSCVCLCMRGAVKMGPETEDDAELVKAVLKGDKSDKVLHSSTLMQARAGCVDV